MSSGDDRELDAALRRIQALESTVAEHERVLDGARARAAELEAEVSRSTAELETASAENAALRAAADAANERAEAAEASMIAISERREQARARIAAAVARGRPIAVSSQAEPRRDDARTHRMTGDNRYAEADYAGAARDYRIAAELEPDHAGTWYRLARALRGLKRHGDALEAADRALELRPGWRDAEWLALSVSSQEQDTSGFIARAERIAPVASATVEDLERLAPLALRAGAHPFAERVGETLLARDARSRVGLLTYAAARWEQGDERAGEALIETALSTGDRPAVRAALDFSHRIDRFDRARELLSRLRPPDAGLMTRFAEYYVKRGEPDPALELLDGAERAGASAERLSRLRAGAAELQAVRSRAWATPRGAAQRVDRDPGRIMHLISRSLPYHTSGGTYRNHYVALSQREAGLTPELVTEVGFPQGGDAGPIEELNGIRYHRIPGDGVVDGPLDARLRRSLEHLERLARELRPAALHPASDYRNAMLALELRERLGIPVVYEVRGFPEERRVRRPGSRATNDRGVGRRAMELECMLAADRVVTLAEVMKAHIVARGVPAEKVHLVPNAVDVQRLAPVPRDAALGARLGIEPGETVLGYVSTFYGYEGIHYIVQATAELVRRGHRARALLVGDGHERARLEQVARDEGIADRVVFTGRVPHEEVPAYLAQIDLFVVPRRAEATSELVTPLKPFEAMAAERTVIVSDVGALREVVVDGETGRTFVPDDAQSLADVAERLIEDPATARRLAANGRAWVAAERTWTRNGLRYRELYEALDVV